MTFRTAFASLTALFIGLIIGPAVVRRLREFQIGQYIREDGPKAHQQKAGTPTMGGVLIVVGMIVPTLLWADLSNRFVWIAVVATLAFGAIGFADDYLKVVHRRNLGLTARAKLLYQFLAAFAIGRDPERPGDTWTVFHAPDRALPQAFPARPGHRHAWHHGYLRRWRFCRSWLSCAIVIVGSSNAVNLTDGLDGLAIGCTVIAAGALTVLTYVSGHAVFADYLELSKMPQVSEVTIFCGSMVGSAIGFLWYNAHPAEIFMGDVGSLALGGAIGTVAVLIKQELLLPFIGGVFVIEALSVILQVGSYKLRRKRIFKMAPIHHHFELLGWSESKVIVRFWIASLVFALFALTTLKLR